MNATTTFKQVAEELAGAFETHARADGSDFVRLKDDAPAWIEEAGVLLGAHQALDDRFPDDWVYEAASRIADELSGRGFEEADDARDAVTEIADGLVDVYNADRSRWLASHLGNAALCDEAAEEYGQADGIFEAIGRGQFLALERIAHSLIEAIETEAGSREEAEEIGD